MCELNTSVGSSSLKNMLVSSVFFFFMPKMELIEMLLA